jgi:hypothetical protein
MILFFIVCLFINKYWLVGQNAMNQETFIKKLKANLCGKIFDKEAEYLSNIVHMCIFIKDIKVLDGKINLVGVRISGVVLYNGQLATKTELSEISYKLSLQKDGMISMILHNTMWNILTSRLKHFNLTRADVEVKDFHFLTTKRFFNHVKVYIPLDSTKK